MSKRVISIYKSPNIKKKYRALFSDGSHVDFGARGMQQYYDKIGDYEYLDHRDQGRRRLYIARHSAIKKKDGTRAIDDKNSAAYLSLKYLW